MKISLKNNKGITLIALVITIIVLLILAGVSISMLTGDNGILTQATKAKEKQADGTVVEATSLLWNEYQVEKNTGEGNSDFLDYLENTKGCIDSNGIINVKKFTGNDIGRGLGANGTSDVYKIEEENGKYSLKYYGKENEEQLLWEMNKNNTETGEINWDEIFENAKPAEGQCESNKTIGLDSKGNPVNMDYWISEKYEEYEGYGDWEGYRLSETVPIGSSLEQIKGYIGEIDENGKIQGEIPKYIKKEDDNKFLEVIGLKSTFKDCENLKVLPEIPSSIVDMRSAFKGCTNLTTVPEIPSSVVNMERAFEGCTNLIIAPKIPSSVVDMHTAFKGCTNLKTAPEIPSSVVDMHSAFKGCTNLKTAPEIPSSVVDMGSAFEGCTNLTTVPEIPSRVENLQSTFKNCKNLRGELKINSREIIFRLESFYNAATSGEVLTLVGSNEEILNMLKETGSANSKIEIRVER